MTNADLIDLALCGGYVYEDNVCDCCGHDNGKWVKAEMPVMGCREQWQSTLARISKIVELQVEEYARNQFAELRIKNQIEPFVPHTKIGETINVAKPRRWQQ